MTPQAHYLRLYKQADEILKQPDNPCQIKPIGDGTFTCAHYTTPNRDLCCVAAPTWDLKAARFNRCPASSGGVM